MSEIQGTKLSWMQVCNTKNRFCQIFCTLIFGNMHGIKQQNIHPWILLLRYLQYDSNHPNSPSSSISRPCLPAPPRRSAAPPMRYPLIPLLASTQQRKTWSHVGATAVWRRLLIMIIEIFICFFKYVLFVFKFIKLKT